MESTLALKQIKQRVIFTHNFPLPSNKDQNPCQGEDTSSTTAILSGCGKISLKILGHVQEPTWGFGEKGGVLASSSDSKH